MNDDAAAAGAARQAVGGGALRARRRRSPHRYGGPSPRSVLVVALLIIGAILVVWSPLLMYQALGASLPWPALADVGQAYGGASALLSAAALSGIGASLILQARQMRQELVGLDKQRHFDLVKLALDNPEFFAVVDGDLDSVGDLRLRTYANLMMNYWLAMWELGEVGEPELRGLAAGMFVNDTARIWWGQMQGRWITTRSRRRRRFMTVVDEKWSTAATFARPPAVAGISPAVEPGEKRRRGGKAIGVALFFGTIGALAGAGLVRRRGRQ